MDYFFFIIFANAKLVIITDLISVTVFFSLICRETDIDTSVFKEFYKPEETNQLFVISTFKPI